MPSAGTDSLRAGPARSSLGRWAPGLGERAARVTHSLPGARWPHPCSSANRGPPAPHQGPRAAGAGRGAGEQDGLPSSCEPAGAGGRAQGARASPAQPDRPRTVPSACPAGGQWERAAGPGQGSGQAGAGSPAPLSPTFPVGALLARPARPGPAPAPAFLAGACGFLPAPGARSWLAAGRGPRLQGIPASPSRGPLPPRTRVGGLQEGEC